MLSQWRTFGYFFSPVNFFFCFDPTGVQVESVVAEVNNTPWGEQHCYVLWQGNRVSDGKLSFSCKKEFHVSPFMALDLNYRWSVTDPSDALTIHIQAMRDENRELDSTLRLRRYELSAGRWLLNVARYPLIPPRILAGVYFEALRLWLKKAPYYPHPNQGASKGAIPPRELMPASEQPVVSDKSLDDASSENERLPAG
jgi:DUF1365 family protein